MTPRLRTTVAVLGIGAAALTSLAQDHDAPPGVFPIVVPNPEDNKTSIVGSAFLVSARHGLLVTAAHVLIDADVDAGDEERTVQFECQREFGRSDKMQRFSTTMKARVACWGDGRPFQECTNTKHDWAALVVEEQADRTRLAGFRPLVMRRDQTFGGEVAAMERSKSLALIVGYPLGAPERRPQRVEPIRESVEGSPLRIFHGTVSGGNSGGPCYWDDGHTLWLFGIVIAEDEDVPGHHLVLPTPEFIGQLAGGIGNTPTVRAVIAHLERDAQGLDAGMKAFDAFLALHQLEPFEHWQLGAWLCAGGGATEVVKHFLYDFFEIHAESRAFIERVLSCRGDVWSHVRRDAADLQARIKAGKPITDRAVAGLALASAESVLSGALALNDEHPHLASSFMTNAIYIGKALYGDVDEDSAQVMLRRAFSLDDRNPDLAAATALAAVGLTPFDRLQLTSDLVQFSDADMTIGVRPKSDRLVFREIWEDRVQTAMRMDDLVLSDRERRKLLLKQFGLSGEPPFQAAPPPRPGDR